MEFAREGSYTVSIIVNDVEVGSFSVEVRPPPPSYLDRFPLTSAIFLVGGAVIGGLLYRAMGREELVSEIRPAPLDIRASATE